MLGQAENKASIFYKFNNQLDYLHQFDEDYKLDLKNFMTLTREYEDKWQHALTIISRKKDDMQVDFKEKLLANENASYPFLLGLHKIFEESSSVENYTEFHIAYKNFIKPLEALCKKSEGDKNLLIIINNVNDAILAYQNLLQIRSITKFNLVSKARSLRKIEKSLSLLQRQITK